LKKIKPIFINILAYYLLIQLIQLSIL